MQIQRGEIMNASPKGVAEVQGADFIKVMFSNVIIF